jgi:LAS superfamily LD-carboxypeptidase LdcB
VTSCTRLIAVITAASLLSPVLSIVPANANEKVIDICANKSTAKVREITKGACKYSEWSLGASQIKPGKQYPTAMHSKMANRWYAVRVAAAKAGYTLIMTSGFRRLVDQQYLYKQAIKKYGSAKKAAEFVLPPKFSMHPRGLAIDINRNKGLKSAAKWVELNGWKWGLCRRYDNEFWHFEPLVGPGKKCPPREPNALSAIPDGYWDK